MRCSGVRRCTFSLLIFARFRRLSELSKRRVNLLLQPATHDCQRYGRARSGAGNLITKSIRVVNFRAIEVSDHIIFAQAGFVSSAAWLDLRYDQPFN